MFLWIICALSAPVLWGIANVFDGASRRHFVKNDAALTWFSALAHLPFAAALFWAAGISLPSLSSVFWMIISGILWVLPFYVYFKAIEHEEVSRIVLLLQITPVFTLIIAFFLLGEKLTAHQGAGFFILILAGILASLKKMKKEWKISNALFLMGIAAFLYALSDVLFKKFEPAFSGFLSASAVYFLGGGIPALLAPLHPKGQRFFLRHFKNLPLRAWILLIGATAAGIAGSLLFAKALTLGKASLTAVLMGIQPLVAFLGGIGLSYIIPEVEKEETDRKALILKGTAFALVIIGLITLKMG